MKKVASGVLIVVMMMLVLVACGSKVDANDPAIGTYKLDSMSAAGTGFTADELTSLGVDISGWTLEIGADGKFSMVIGSATGTTDLQTVDGTWKASGNEYKLTAKGETITAKFDANSKTMTISIAEGGSDMSIVFVK